MKINFKKLIVCIALPLAVGGVASLITSDAMESFKTLNKPPLSPPAILFPIVWTLLYTLMGIASYIILTSNSGDNLKKSALNAYGAQLLFNFFWSIIFFSFQKYLFALIWLIALWILIAVTIKRFKKISNTASYLLIPYIIWVTFALYLNLGIFILN